ncbi:SDR family oxidoreductase [Tropicimonas sp. IMCC6043]|uniref:SDR family NAD(P)-dependent oxidoreductase n=1 Tax=Tropicimonas sp. IMCC6043 TaxID=2510645 RepID=UPI00101BCB38|nr:SDR family NAD(P)-dependent oxidoreductase [Tropicimonas sp. IMCC6043]RYH09649.1 SDR family NAD(P)-dependent oxidoreductase [Tropicimonas sp. IMCC6043]
MRELAGKRYWLIGASEGLGRALAQQMSAAGCDLVLSARNAEALETLSRDLPVPAVPLPLDIRDSAACARVGATLGPLDGMVYLAAVYWPMGVEEWNTEHAEAMLDTNLTGAVRAFGAVFPGMQAQGHGHLVFVGSLAGYRGLPRALGYGASKAGVMSLAETLRCELRGSGIDVQMAAPGFIRSRLTEKNDFPMPQIMEPEAAAARLLRHMRGKRFACAFPRPFSLALRAAQFLPESLYYRLF